MKPALVCDVGVLNACKSCNVDDSQFRLYIEPLQTGNTFISILLSTKQVLAIIRKTVTSRSQLPKECEHLQKCYLFIFVLCRESEMHSSIKAVAPPSFLQLPLRMML